MPIQKGMRVFPGISEPILEKVRTHEENGLQVSKLIAVVHTGTHVDSPRHVINNAETISDIPLDRLIGEAVVLDLKYKPPGSVISEDDLREYAADIQKNDVVVLNTEYEEYGRPEFLIDGEWVDSKSSNVEIDTNPATDEAIAEFSNATNEEAIQAMEGAHQAIQSWRDGPPQLHIRFFLSFFLTRRFN
jgi:kynurenine formamidase